MVNKLNTVALYVKDQQKTANFYVEVLGLEVRRDEDMGPMGRWLEVAPKGAETAFVIASAEGFDKKDRIGNSADVVLHSNDVQSLFEKAKAAGSAVSEPETQAWGTFIKVTDPDGQDVVISQPK